MSSPIKASVQKTSRVEFLLIHVLVLIMIKCENYPFVIHTEMINFLINFLKELK